MIQFFGGGRGQKWPWLVSSWDSKICCILRMNFLIDLIWCNNLWLDWYPLWLLNAEGLLQLYFLFSLRWIHKLHNVLRNHRHISYTIVFFVKFLVVSNKSWSDIKATYNKHFQLGFSFVVKAGTSFRFFIILI